MVSSYSFLYGCNITDKVKQNLAYNGLFQDKKACNGLMICKL